MDLNNFYVYMYLDPRKYGKYNYNKYSFDYEPFYVGKGKKNQYLAHLKEAKNYNKCYSGNFHKFNKIKKIIQEGLEPIVIKFKDNVNEKQAFELERSLISVIGRSDLKSGPLTNQTDGGEGSSGYLFTEEDRERSSKVWRGKKRPNFSRENHPNWKGGITTNRKLCPICGEREVLQLSKMCNKCSGIETSGRLEVKEKKSKARKGKRTGPRSIQIREKISKALKGKPKSEETRKNMSISAKNRPIEFYKKQWETRRANKILNVGEEVNASK